MHAVIVNVTVSDREEATRHLHEKTVPEVKQAPGLVAGYWTRSGDSGTSMVVFESEEVATTMSERVPTLIPDAVTLNSVEVCEVVAHT